MIDIVGAMQRDLDAATPFFAPHEALAIGRARDDFPALQQQVRGHPLVYLDSAATTQIPASVIAAVQHFEQRDRSNVHRGVHALSQRATEAYEGARATVADWLNAASEREIIFCRGTTEALNLVAASYGNSHVSAGDEVLVSEMEHHSNIVPWQLLCEQVGARLRVIPVTDSGELDLRAYSRLLGERTRIVAITHVSNVLGTINPLQELTRRAHAAGAVVVVDGAQAVAHLAVDVQAIDCDFYAFSGHKLYAPTGIGVLYGKAALLKKMPPYQSGGDMIRKVSFAGTTYAEPPERFEAGTPNIAGAIGLATAIDYLRRLDLQRIAAHEQCLLQYATKALEQVDDLQLLGSPAQKCGVLSFTLDGIHPHDIGTILDTEGVAIRAGHHCAQPLMARYGVAATARASLACYNTVDDVDALVSALQRAREIFGGA